MPLGELLFASSAGERSTSLCDTLAINIVSMLEHDMLIIIIIAESSERYH